MGTLELYTDLFRIRRSEEKIIELYSTDEMKTPMHMSMGQEAVSVALCHSLEAGDRILGSYRTHALYLARTRDTLGFFGEMFGKSLGAGAGRAGSMHLARPEAGFLFSSAVVASQIPVALGVAHAQKVRGGRDVTCVIFGDGATDEGVFWESINAACTLKLPLIFLCEDNGWAVHTPPELRQGYKNLSEIVRRFNLEVRDFESTDVRELKKGFSEVIEKSRKNRVPAFIRSRCYRYLEHVGVAYDFQAGYRPEAEYKQWLERDPVKVLREGLMSEGMTEAAVLEAERKIETEVTAAVTKARSASEPKGSELMDHMNA